ncbi:hypothetical protein KGM_215643 [Danaus plexippus plexippus]|uniref:Regulatory protein zeste n=1 Tax=Danaus plexippus plexippus TaxID=278856 RepID=A0A212ELJ9_DANPL|nr:uncharacterized protein LOC116778744 [Danaus plexippus plexippus]OWR42364.1 hypothetical protein KGM_215643 [Danaus plexippus plexippus]
MAELLSEAENSENTSRQSRPSLTQVRAIVQFMEKNPDLAHKRFRNGIGHEKFKNFWIELSNNLNTMNGAMKSTKGWIKFWSDKRRSLLMKQRQINSGKVNERLSPLEQRIVTLSIPEKPTKRRTLKTEINGDADSHDNASDMEEKEFGADNRIVSTESDDRFLNMMEKLALAVDKIASTFEAISASVYDVRNAIIGIDYTMKRCFPQAHRQNNIFS